MLEKAPSCPEPTAIRHIRDAAIEFCRRTRCWRFEDTRTIDSADEGEFAVEPDSTVFEVSHARFGDVDLEARSADWLDKNVSGWRTADPGTPKYLTQVEIGAVLISPPPSDPGTLVMELILVPSNDAEQLPDMLVDDYGTVVADGALARILVLPADFRDLQLATFYAAQFAEALGHWSVQSAQGQQRAPLRTRPGGFF